jgi:hypothetical protein
LQQQERKLNIENEPCFSQIVFNRRERAAAYHLQTTLRVVASNAGQKRNPGRENAASIVAYHSPVDTGAKHLYATSKQCIASMTLIREQFFDQSTNLGGRNCTISIDKAEQFRPGISHGPSPS